MTRSAISFITHGPGCNLARETYARANLDLPIDTLYEFVDLWSYLVHSRPDQDLMFAEGPG